MHLLSDELTPVVQPVLEGVDEALLECSVDELFGQAASRATKLFPESVVSLHHACDALSDIRAHGTRAAKLAVDIGRVLHLRPDDLAILHYSAVAHDAGKALVDPTIRDRNGLLSVAQMQAVRNHTIFGRTLVHAYFFSTPAITTAIADVALLHHERWDGAGYPLGLRGPDIPLFAQIAAVADVFDALTSVRIYKRAWSVEAAAAAILAQREMQFSPACVDAFETLINDLSQPSSTTSSIGHTSQ
jgi:HD-GYP domain-containing protein (c-di-GMP phosphodiesterase class II)